MLQFCLLAEISLLIKPPIKILSKDKTGSSKASSASPCCSFGAQPDSEGVLDEENRSPREGQPRWLRNLPRNELIAASLGVGSLRGAGVSEAAPGAPPPPPLPAFRTRGRCSPGFQQPGPARGAAFPKGLGNPRGR